MRGEISASASRHELGELIAAASPRLMVGPTGAGSRGAGSPHERARKGSEPGGGERILVVEDDYFVALEIESGLADAGYDVIALVPSGEEALELVDRARPALVLMDIRLSGRLDGIETACTLLDRGIRVVFASAHSDPSTRERGELAQPLGWLTKPFTGHQMIAAIGEALRRNRN